MDDLKRLLAELVAIPSVSGEEAQAADFAAERLTRAGLEVERIGDSVFARATRGRGPRLFLNSHLDTVPAGPSWSAEPWRAQWQGGRLVGLGANDAKASVASMIAALGDWAASADRDGEVWLALTACEETSNAGMTAVLDWLAASGLGQADGAVTGEPTGLEVVRAQSGLAVLEARWSGRSCHAAHVARVAHENALFKAVQELSGLPEYALFDAHPLLGASTLVATVLCAGERHNRVPDEAVAVFDARLAPPHDAAECCAYLAARLPQAEIRVRSERLLAVDTPAEHPLVRAALAASGRGAAIGSATMSDMALLAGTPSIKCGPGQTARSHTPDEYVLAEELEAGARFYRALVPLALDALAHAPGGARS